MKVAVVGLGKLGCPLAAWLSTRHEVVGVDVDAETVRFVNVGAVPVEEPGLAEVMVETGGFPASTGYEIAVDADAAFVIVPTPSLRDGAFSLEHVEAALDGLRPHYSGPVVVTSTVMPGHMDALRWDGPLLYNPWFVALGSVLRDFRHPPFVLVGQRDDEEGRWLAAFWRGMGVSAKVRRMSFVEAEMVKLSLNAYVVMKVTYANWLDDLCRGLGADGRAVAEAVGLDPRVGSKYFSPGTPVGGPCFPRDSRALARAAHMVGVAPRLPLAADMEGATRLYGIVQRAIATGAGTFAVLGLAYKPGTHVTEESAGLKIAAALKQSGKEVVWHDPLAAAGLPAQEVVDRAEAVVVATAWDEYRDLDYGGKPVVDPWGVTDGTDD